MGQREGQQWVSLPTGAGEKVWVSPAHLCPANSLPILPPLLHPPSSFLSEAQVAEHPLAKGINTLN